VHCSLPPHLQNGIAFREDGKHCGGCLNYEPRHSPSHFTISPVNCSTEANENKDYRNIPIHYSCLATFQFHNNTHLAVTKTINFVKGMGQYLVWIFTPDHHIKVMKAADTFLFEHNPMLKSEFIQAQFSILRGENLQCRNLFSRHRPTTTTNTYHPKANFGNKPDQEYNHGEHADIKHDDSVTGPAVNGDDHIPYGPENGADSQISSPKMTNPRFDNSQGENIDNRNNARSRNCVCVHSILWNIFVAVLVVLTSHRTCLLFAQ
ncbi:unnamed protein product, partial [Candidula unifasciata]